ncbi:unnamed protein product [Brassica oleracea]
MAKSSLQLTSQNHLLQPPSLKQQQQQQPLLLAIQPCLKMLRLIQTIQLLWKIFQPQGVFFLTPPPEVSSDIPPYSGGLSFTPFTGDCTGYFNEFEMAQRSRHGRELKPSQKVQDMQWQTVRGRKSQGCRGRGRHGDQH